MSTLFLRDPESFLLTSTINPDCDWVYSGTDWKACVDVDGSACYVKNGRLFQSYYLKEKFSIPVGWWHKSGRASEEHGHGWLPVRVENPQDRYHLEAWNNENADFSDGHYTLFGPKVNGNPYRATRHHLETRVQVRKALSVGEVPENPADWAGFFVGFPVQGIKFIHNDGRIATIKAKDVGVPWPPAQPKK